MLASTTFRRISKVAHEIFVSNLALFNGVISIVLSNATTCCCSGVAHRLTALITLLPVSDQANKTAFSFFSSAAEH